MSLTEMAKSGKAGLGEILVLCWVGGCCRSFGMKWSELWSGGGFWKRSGSLNWCLIGLGREGDYGKPPQEFPISPPAGWSRFPLSAMTGSKGWKVVLTKGCAGSHPPVPLTLASLMFPLPHRVPWGLFTYRDYSIIFRAFELNSNAKSTKS